MSVLATTDPWLYVGITYGLAFAAIVAYIAMLVVRGRRAGRRLPPQDRRWS
jgi:hypothetical protein